MESIAARLFGSVAVTVTPDDAEGLCAGLAEMVAERCRRKRERDELCEQRRFMTTFLGAATGGVGTLAAIGLKALGFAALVKLAMLLLPAGMAATLVVWLLNTRSIRRLDALDDASAEKMAAIRAPLYDSIDLVPEHWRALASPNEE